MEHFGKSIQIPNLYRKVLRIETVINDQRTQIWRRITRNWRMQLQNEIGIFKRHDYR